MIFLLEYDIFHMGVLAMRYLYPIGLVLGTIVSLIFSVMGFMGKDVILDDTYTKASKEDREKMDKNAYRRQSSVFFLFIFVSTVCNLLRYLTAIPLFSYIGIVAVLIAVIHFIISHYAIKKRVK